MARLKSHPFFSALLVVCGLAVLAEVYLLLPFSLPFNLTSGRNEALARLAEAQTSYKKLRTEKITPDAENKMAVEADRVQAETVLATTRDALTGKGGLPEKLRAEPVPADSISTWTSIGLYQKRQLKKFQEATAEAEPGAATEPDEAPEEVAAIALPKLKFKPDDWFGFAAFKHAGPSDPDIIRQVFRQTQVADYLLDTLLAAKPTEFISLLREAPLPKAVRDEQDKALKEASDKHEPPPVFSVTTTNADEASDYFDVDPLSTSRVPGSVETTGFQLTFIGKTDTLRRFLNKLAQFELPIKVQRVEIAADKVSAAPPFKSELDDEGNPVVLGPADQPKLVVATLYSKFTVTVEYIDLIAPAKPTTPPSP